MKKITVSFLTIICAVCLFAGCGEKTADGMKSDISSTVSEIKSDISSTVSRVEEGLESGLMDSSTQNGSNVSGTISKEEAKKIALKHANVNESDVYDVEIELDQKNGTKYYDIDFETKSHEYDYDINAQTGEIISSSKEAQSSMSSR